VVNSTFFSEFNHDGTKYLGYRKGEYVTYLVKLIGEAEVFRSIEKVNMLNRSTEIGEAGVLQGIEKANC
jgi:hypothetical protein